MIARGAVRELTWGLPRATREIRRWSALAQAIPDARLRADAVGSITDKRYYLDGAVLYATLPSRRVDELLALLVAYQVMANYLDYTSERGVAHRGASGDGTLMQALVDAVDVEAPLGDYYADHPWADDSGFLRALVVRCRTACLGLPRYREARALLIEEARRGVALEYCHDTAPARRDAALRSVARTFSPTLRAPWFELAGSATSLLAIPALAAVAADEMSDLAQLEAVRDLYCPWVGALALMLDSFVDREADLVSGAWSAIAYYPNIAEGADRIAELAARAFHDAALLRNGERHVLIVAMMLAMFLTSDGAASAARRDAAARLVRSGGGMTRVLTPALRGWRFAYSVRG